MRGDLAKCFDETLVEHVLLLRHWPLDKSDVHSLWLGLDWAPRRLDILPGLGPGLPGAEGVRRIRIAESKSESQNPNPNRSILCDFACLDAVYGRISLSPGVHDV